ncbi:MAG: FIST N-terminal domain-containing protein [Candidatus Omnitrophota bacterium]
MNVSFGSSQIQEHVQAANEAVGQAIIGLKGAPANLALLFTSAEFAHPMVLKTANNLLGEIPVLGCNSSGIITNKGILKYGIAVLLLSLGQQTFFNTACVKDINGENSFLSGKELGNKLLYGFKEVRRSITIILSDRLITDGTNLINGVQEDLGRSFPLIGASGSDNFANQRAFQYFNNELVSDACCGIIFGGKFSFGFGTKHGWKPLGRIRTASKSSSNIIKEIDGEPAIKLYEDYFAKDMLELAKELRRISIFYPIGIYLPGEKEYLLRNVISIHDDGSLVTQGDVPQESKIRLMISTEESRIAAAISACEEAKRNLGNQKVKFVLVFNSAARFFLLGRQHEKEIGVIKEAFGGDTPLIGIYTNGEQAPLKSISYLGQTYFHNQSINILAIGEQ